MIKRPVTYWLTRDTNSDGETSGHVEVWCVLPVREASGKRVVWRAPDGLPAAQCSFGRYTRDLVTAWFRVAPDDDLQCVRVDTVEIS